jgi:LacI family transcriptional regulator, galactose operon repressor
MPEPSQDSMYWSLPIKGMAKGQEELAPRKVRVRYFFYDKYSESSFNRVSKEAIASNLDGLLIAPVLSKVFDQFVKEIREGLPYVFFDSFVPKANYISYIGQDSFQSGILSARLMQMLVKDKGNIAVIRMLPEDYHIDDRVNGFLSYCKRCPKIVTKVYGVDGNKSTHVRNEIFQKIISENDRLSGVFVTNASTHQIAEYIKRLSLGEKIHIIGYDLIEENVRFLREGVIDFLISQQSERQGYEGIYCLYRHVVLKETVEKKIMMQLDIVTSENIAYYRS